MKSKMNVENIQSYLNECFRNDGIEKDDIICKETDNIKKSFVDYVEKICLNVDFYDYSKDIYIKDDDESIDDIKKEMTFENIGRDDIQDLNFVYDWFFTDRIRFFLKEDFNFFLDLVENEE